MKQSLMQYMHAKTAIYITPHFYGENQTEYFRSIAFY